MAESFGGGGRGGGGGGGAVIEVTTVNPKAAGGCPFWISLKVCKYSYDSTLELEILLHDRN